MDPTFLRCVFWAMCVFLSFFLLQPHILTKSAVNSAFVHCSWVSQITFFINFFIKNWSHNIIHKFKNYFATVFLIFSFQFQQNKFYPNRPLVFNIWKDDQCHVFQHLKFITNTMHATHISKDAYIINDLKILVWKLWKDINFIVSLPTVKTENQIKLVCPRERNTMQFAAENGLTQPSHNKWDCNCIWDCRALFEKVAYSMTSLPHCTKIPCSTHSANV